MSESLADRLECLDVRRCGPEHGICLHCEAAADLRAQQWVSPDYYESARRGLEILLRQGYTAETDALKKYLPPPPPETP